MIGAILFLLLAFAVGLVIWKSSQPPTPPPDPEQAVKAAVELHRIRRNLDASLLKTEQRREAARLRRDIAEVMKEPEDD